MRHEAIKGYADSYYTYPERRKRCQQMIDLVDEFLE
jgi:hypothetical protein